MKFEETLSLAKETPGTFRYETGDTSSRVPTIYLKKDGSPAPKSIKLVIEG